MFVKREGKQDEEVHNSNKCLLMQNVCNNNLKERVYVGPSNIGPIILGIIFGLYLWDHILRPFILDIYLGLNVGDHVKCKQQIKEKCIFKSGPKLRQLQIKEKCQFKNAHIIGITLSGKIKVSSFGPNLISQFN